MCSISTRCTAHDVQHTMYCSTRCTAAHDVQHTMYCSTRFTAAHIQIHAYMQTYTKPTTHNPHACIHVCHTTVNLSNPSHCKSATPSKPTVLFGLKSHPYIGMDLSILPPLPLIQPIFWSQSGLSREVLL